MLKIKHWVVVIEAQYDGAPVRFKHVVEALDPTTAVAKVGYRIGKKLSATEIISASVKEA